MPTDFRWRRSGIMADVLRDIVWRAALSLVAKTREWKRLPKRLGRSLLRLGAFVASYFSLMAILVIGLALLGVTAGLGIVIVIIPLAVFAAIRVVDMTVPRF